MRWSLPIVLFVILAGLHYSADGERYSEARNQLGKALLRRARQISEPEEANAEDAEENDIPEEERERVQQLDAAEDIFVGSGNHVYENQGRSETSGAKRTETSGDHETEAKTEEDEDSPTSGDAGEDGEKKDDDGDDDESEESDEEDDDDNDVTEKSKQDKQEQEATDTEDESGSGLEDDENAARRSMDASGSGSGSGFLTGSDGPAGSDVSTASDQLSDENNDASGSGESTIQEMVPTNTSVSEASGNEFSETFGSGTTEDESASKKSEIETASGDSDDEEEEDNGSAEVIRKGIESLTRLLTPVASGYDFELYSGNAAKQDKKENENEAEGESEKGYSSDAAEVHVKKCKKVCKDPMTYDQCAVPRCGYKMGTIKDLCIYLCKHQTPVCSQECE